MITIEADSANPQGQTFVESAESWFDALDWADTILCVEAPSVVTSGGDTLDISLRTMGNKGDESLASQGGMATEIWELVNVTSGTRTKKAIYLAQGNANPIDRWLFWVVSVNGTGGPWRLTFQVTATLKRDA